MTEKIVAKWMAEQLNVVSAQLLKALKAHQAMVGPFAPGELIVSVHQAALLRIFIAIFGLELSEAEMDQLRSELLAVCKKYQDSDETAEAAPNLN